MIGSAIVDRCEARYGDTGNAVVSAADWLEYVNDAYMDVVAADPYWPFLETQTTGLSVTGGTGSVALPADAWRVTSVYNSTDKIPLTPIPGRSNYRRYYPDPASSLGVPQFYRLRGATLEVYPWPSSTTLLTIDTATPPAALTTGTEPIFPEQYHRILVVGALAKVYEDDANAAMAASHQARFDRLLQAMRTDLLSPRDEGFPQILDLGA